MLDRIDGLLLIGGADGTARLWDAVGSKELRHPFGVETVAFSADGRQVLTRSSDGTARLGLMAAIAEAEQLLAEGCVSHSYFEFYTSAIEMSLEARDWSGARRSSPAASLVTLGRFS